MMKRSRLNFQIREIALPALSGLLLLFSFPPFNLWFVAFFAWLPLLIAIEGRSRWQALQAGGIAGVVFFGFLIYWLGYVTALGYTLLVLYLSFYPAVFCFLLNSLPGVVVGKKATQPRWSRRRTRWSGRYSAPFSRPLWGGLIWAELEFFRSSGLFAFSWGLMGHSQWNVPQLSHSANWWGVYGLSFLVMAVNLALSEFWLARKRGDQPKNAWLWPLGLVVMVAMIGHVKKQEPLSVARKVRVALLQGNFNQEEKWNVPVDETLATYLRMSDEVADLHPDLIVWPETALPDILSQDMDYGWQISAWVKQNNIPLLFGAIGQIENDITNSAFYVTPQKEKEPLWRQYDKVHLVPYGESVPFKHLFPFIEKMVEDKGGGEYRPGHDFPTFEVNGTRFGVLICFESTLPKLARKYARRRADFLVVITNDAWFLRSAAPYQHAIQSAFRAIETGMPVVRATNTGLTCGFDSRGKMLGEIPIYEENYLMLDLTTGRHPTLYTRWGDLLLLVALGITLGYFCGHWLVPERVRTVLRRKRKDQE